MIIDVHSHDFPDTLAPRAMNGMCRRLGTKLSPSADGLLGGHLDALSLAGVDKAVACPIATRPDMFEGIFRRSLAIRDGELGERARRMIIPFASVHPLDPHVLRHLRQIAEAGLKGVKFHCFFQEFSLADRELWPVFRTIAELGLVVQCHCGADAGWDFVGLCGPHEIETLLKNVRGLKFIAAHLGGCDGYPSHATDGLLETGCYIDTSVLNRRWHYDEPMRLLRSWPKDRILFGTDSPWVHYPEAIRWVKSVRVPEDWNALFGENACRLLSISSEPSAIP